MAHVLVLQLDGKMPNLALMRLAAFHRGQGDRVTYRRAGNAAGVERGLYDAPWSKVYASLIFERTRPLAARLLEVYPNAVVGGSGWDETATLEGIGVPAGVRPDYSDHPDYPHSVGYTHRGCRLACSFCKVRRMEGRVRPVASIAEVWRGEPHPRNVLLLDNDFFGNPQWRERIDELNSGGFKVCFNQGINVRVIADEHAAAIASTAYRDDQFKTRRLYTAWDNRKDEATLFRGLSLLTKHGVRPDDILVYMLVGYWDGPRLTDDDLHRHRRLREFGCRPYPMPFARTPELVGFQRWVVTRADLKVSWEDYRAAGCRPENLRRPPAAAGLFDGLED